MYRWVIQAQDGSLKVLVGETERFPDRLKDYLTSASYKDFRAMLQREVAAGGTVELYRLDFDEFVIDVGPDSKQIKISLGGLSNPHVRLIIEALAVLQSALSGHSVLNQGVDIYEKQARKAYEKLPAEMQQRIGQEEFVRGVQELKGTGLGKAK